MDDEPPANAPAPRRSAAPARWSLEWTLPLLISSLLVVVVALYGSAAYEEMRGSSIAAARGHLRSVSRELAQLASRGSAARTAQLRAVAADTAVRRLLRDGGPPRTAAMALERIEAVTDSTAVGTELWSADGVRRLVRGTASSPDDSVALRRVIAEVARVDSLRRSPLYGDPDGRVHTWTVLPSHDGDRLVGFVAECRRLANNARTEEQIRQLTGQHVSVLFANRDASFWSDLRGRPVTAPFAMRAGRDSFTVARADGGGRLFGARAAVAGAPYSIVLTLAEAAVLRRPRDFLARMLAFGVVLLLVGTAGAWVLSRHVTRPLRVVTDAADAVSGGDYTRRVAIDRRDELGRLANTFNAMAARIGASHDELALRAEQSSALATELAQRNDELGTAQRETMRAERRTQRLQSVTAALAGALDFEEVANVFVTRALEAAGARAGAIFLATEDGAWLELVRSEGYADGTFPLGSRIAVSAALPVALAARTQAPVYVASPAEWTARFGPAPAQSWRRSDAWTALPVIARGRVIAVLGLSFVGAPAFDPETRGFLLSLAQQCGQALDRATLFDAAVHARHAAEEAREAAQEANQAKSAFLAMMSHELRTPLNAIGGYTELLELGLRGPVTDAQLEDLSRIRRNKDHLLAIINDILNLARIEAGHLAVHVEDVAVIDVLAETEGAVAPLVAAKGLRYEVRGAGSGIRVRADRERLQQVLLNFVSNAVRFTDAGGTVALACDAAGPDTVRLSVRDTGIGIPADRLEAIFEPFVQVDAGLTRRTGGTGLGLAISRDLARAMGGRIAVESQLGHGSVFTLFLPRSQPVPAGAAVPPSPSARPTGATPASSAAR